MSTCTHDAETSAAADASATEALLAQHSFLEDEDGDGWNEPRTREYRCSCTKARYGEWTQRDPEMTGLSVFLEEGWHDAMPLHHKHVAQVLIAAGGGIPAQR